MVALAPTCIRQWDAMVEAHCAATVAGGGAPGARPGRRRSATGAMNRVSETVLMGGAA